MRIKCLYRILVLLLVMALFTSCSSILETPRITSAATYEMAHHELGSTEGQWHVAFHGNAGLSYTMNNITSFYSLEDDTLTGIECKSFSFYGTSFGGGFSLGVLDRMDIRLHGFAGRAVLGRSYGGSVHLKYCVSEKENPTQMSVMPGVGYSFSDQTETFRSSMINDPDLESTSSILGYELVIPISSKTRENQWFTFTPSVYFLDYNVTAQSATPRIINGIEVKATDQRFTIIPSLSFGYRWGNIHPELMLVLMNEKIYPAISFGSVVSF